MLVLKAVNVLMFFLWVLIVFFFHVSDILPLVGKCFERFTKGDIRGSYDCHPQTADRLP